MKGLAWDETQGNVQPMRCLNAWNRAKGARDTATSETSWWARCKLAPSKWSARNEQPLQPSLQPSSNMK
ncbi:hypothetical protein D1872_335690 [compost metagenome]